MVQQVIIPPAGESITSATVAQWHAADGAVVKSGDLLATIETDKVSNELEADADGTLRILVKEGEEVGIGSVIAEIDRAGDAASPGSGAGEPEAEAGAVDEEPSSADDGQAPEPPDPPEPDAGQVFEIKVPAAGESITTATIAQWHKRDGESVHRGESLVTLETDKVSNELEADLDGTLRILTPEGAEVDIGTVIGQVTTGPVASPMGSEPAPVEASVGVPPASASETPRPASEGQSSSKDIEREKISANNAGRAPTLPSSAPPGLEPDGRTTRTRLSMMRRKIATQLVNVQRTSAILTTFNEADMSAVMRLRKQVQEDFVARHGVKLGFMSLFVKAVVQALKEVPALNSRIDGDELVENHFYDIGVAVGTEKGLVVPVIRDADQKSFATIEQDILAYAMKARDGKIELDDMRGGGFTISNGGVYGSLLSTPILNPPQSGILGMHTIQQRPVAVDGMVEIRPMMYLALSYDHRVVDGKGAVTFLINIKESIENPTRLMLEI